MISLTEANVIKPEQAFGQVLKEFRSNVKLSQEKLAQESNLDRTYISLLERGLRQPTLTTMIQLSKALEISLPAFVSAVETVIDENS